MAQGVHASAIGLGLFGTVGHFAQYHSTFSFEVSFFMATVADGAGGTLLVRDNGPGPVSNL